MTPLVPGYHYNNHFCELKLKLDDQKEMDSFAVANVEINDWGDDEYPDFENSDSDAEGCAHFGTFHQGWAIILKKILFKEDWFCEDKL